MTSVNKKLKSTMTNIKGTNWADLCNSSQSSQSQVDPDSPLKNNEVHDKNEDDLYNMVFQPIKKEYIKVVNQDDLSLTSFMNNVHMVTPIKQESDDTSSTRPNFNIDEDTICSPFMKTDVIEASDIKSEPLQINSNEEDLKNAKLHAKRRLTSECESTVSIIPQHVKKVTKTSIDHKNVHDPVIIPQKYVYFY